jgi:hypothetical protein
VIDAPILDIVRTSGSIDPGRLRRLGRVTRPGCRSLLATASTILMVARSRHQIGAASASGTWSTAMATASPSGKTSSTEPTRRALVIGLIYRNVYRSFAFVN